MATTHGLTVLAHSCIKPPRNPKTGLSQTLHERANTYDAYFTEYADDDFARNDEDEGNDLHVKARINPAFDSISRELGNLNDDEFYDKLLQLKGEHKKTLTLCEQLYKRKVLGRDVEDESLALNGHIQNGLSNGFIGSMPKNTVNGNVDVNSSNEFETIENKIDIQHVSSKPPTGKQFFKQTESFKSPGTSVPLPRPSSAPIHRRRGSLTKSLEEEVWAKIASERNISRERFEDVVQHHQDSEFVTRSVEPSALHSAMSKVEDMWENFSVDDYAPSSRRQRPSSATVTRGEKERKKKEWRHRITIPKPFNMTLREASKEKKKTKAQIEAEEKLRQEMISEENECQKKFKAQPVPAHVYLPLYDEISEKNEARRREVKQYSEELLRSQERPFNFATREVEKQKHKRAYSAPQERGKTKNEFKARPVPTHIFDKTIDNKIQEEEEYRKIRIKLRAEELLRKSSLPENMEARERAKELYSKEKSMKSKKKGRSKTKINHEVPDYDELYRHFQKELLRRKQERESTVVQPFNLNTEKISSRKEKIIRDMERDEEVLKENRWPYMNSRSTPRRSLGYLSSSLDALPSNSTKSADLRSSQTTSSKVTMKDKELEEIEQDRRRRIKDMKIRQQIKDRSEVDFNSSLDKYTTRKLREIREAERARMEEYEKELAEMKQRVDKRPLLVERQNQINAKNAAAKKFSATLKSHGIDEDMIQSHSSRAASLYNDSHTGDDYDDDFDHDATYSKSRDDDMEVAAET
ncbi:hypothetical protein FSP39_023139 [Pinctada imbricata]|uniref:Protein FAM161A n=1 Tax=Pinctada imbricata TaxID=66713 RepID=A0AA88Y1B6_PINIB|nr:hypothetical protein FSP39_023139 [Pinctada imbricata]